MTDAFSSPLQETERAPQIAILNYPSLTPACSSLTVPEADGELFDVTVNDTYVSILRLHARVFVLSPSLVAGCCNDTAFACLLVDAGAIEPSGRKQRKQHGDQVAKVEQEEEIPNNHDWAIAAASRS